MDEQKTDNQGVEKRKEGKSSIDSEGIIRFVLLILVIFVYGILFFGVNFMQMTSGQTQPALIGYLILVVSFALNLLIIFRLSSIKLKILLYLLNIFLTISIVLYVTEAY